MKYRGFCVKRKKYIFDFEIIRLSYIAEGIADVKEHAVFDED